MKITKRNNRNLPEVTSEPFGGFLSLRDDIDQLFDNMLRPFGSSALTSMYTSAFAPRVDVSETDTHVVVRADVPGLDPKDVNIELTEDVLSLSGKMDKENEEKGENFYRIERQQGSFSREFTLPSKVDTDSVNAESKNGLLTIKLKKQKSQTKKKVDVKIA